MGAHIRAREAAIRAHGLDGTLRLAAVRSRWPSLTGVNVKPFLEQPVSNDRVFFRVCDWWRREGDLLVENWVFVDVPHALKQLGFDLFAEIGAEAA